MIDTNHHWDNLADIDLNDYLGFIYCIEETSSGRRYYGRKQFWSKMGKNWVESNWRFYTGSSESLNEAINTHGKGDYKFIIIGIFKTKTGMALAEATAIICSGCLEEPDKYYNRSAPSIRGRLKITEDDAEQLGLIREFIHANT